MAKHNDLGKKGEELAVKFLESKGYTILDRNWKFGQEEIDIIAQKGAELIIAEVKTRSGSYFGDPEEFVTPAKQKHLVRAADAYVQEKDLDLEVRFDVVGVIFTGDTHHINHIPDAFQPIA